MASDPWDEIYTVMLGHVALGLGVGLGFALANGVATALLTPASPQVTPEARELLKLGAAVQEIAKEMRSVSRQLGSTCGRVEQWLDVAVDESEYTLNSQGPVADSSRLDSPPPRRLIESLTEEGGTPAQHRGTPHPSGDTPGNAASASGAPETNGVLTLEQICARYDELAAPSAKGEGGVEALRQRCQGAAMVLEHRARIVGAGETEALWRLAASCYVIATKEMVTKRLTELPDATRDLLTEGLRHAEMVAERGHWQGHKWAAVCVGILAKYPDGINDRLMKGKLFMDHITKALELKPDDDLLHYMFGRFLFEVAGVGFLVLRLAAAVFGDAPQATYDDALKQFLAAHRNATGNFGSSHTLWRSNVVYIGKTYIKLGDTGEARKWLQTAADKAADGTFDDEKSLKEAKALLADL